MLTENITNSTPVENRQRIFGVGKRIPGDELLVKDILRTPGQLTQIPIISFNYDVSQFISYIEVSIDKVSLLLLLSAFQRMENVYNRKKDVLIFL